MEKTTPNFSMLKCNMSGPEIVILHNYIRYMIFSQPFDENPTIVEITIILLSYIFITVEFSSNG